MATYYFWDEIEDNVIREYDENNNTIAHYTTEPTLYGRVISQDRGGEVRHYKYDGQGNTVALTDNSGNVTDTRKYSAFGDVTESTGTTDCEYQWGGLGHYSYQSDVHLYYIRRRFYSSHVSRWIAMDPVEMSDEGTNRFGYSTNRPTSIMDPSGNEAIDPFGPRPRPPKWARGLPDCPLINPDSQKLNSDDGWCNEGCPPTHCPPASVCFRSYNLALQSCLRQCRTLPHTRSGHCCDVARGRCQIECYDDYPLGASQQCCYDINGNLIRSGKGAGTPDKSGFAFEENSKSGECVRSALGLIGHFIDDVLPYCLLTQEQYHRGWPPNQGAIPIYPPYGPQPAP